VSGLLLLISGWLQPLHIPPWISWHNEIWPFAAVILLAWSGIYALIKRKEFGSFDIPFASLPIFALGLIAVVQTAAGLIYFAGDALVIGFYVALCAICLSLGFAYQRRTVAVRTGFETGGSGQGNSDVTLLAFVLLIVAFFSTVLALAQIFDLWTDANWIARMPDLRRPGGNLGQPNQLASLLLMGIASLLFLYESRKLTELLAILMLFTLCIGLAVTESRTGLLSFCLLAFWVFAKRRVIGFRLNGWVVVLSMLCFFCLFWAWPALINALLLMTSGATVNTQPGTRLIVWPQLIGALALRPWWGWGIGRVSDAHNAVAHAYAVSEPFTYSHNILLDLSLGVGVPVAALVVLLGAIWLWRRIDDTQRLLPWYCLAVTLPLAVHSMLEFPFAYSYFLVPVMFLLGVLEGELAPNGFVRIGWWPAVMGLFLVTGTMAWSVVEYIAIEEDFRIARFEAMRIGQTPSSYSRPNIILLTQLGALLEGSRTVPAPGMSPENIELARKLALHFPSTALQNRYALSLALNGNPQEAMRQLKVMRAMHGEKAYLAIKTNWSHLSDTQYAQLKLLKIP
jgi:hypothetical protein